MQRHSETATESSRILDATTEVALQSTNLRKPRVDFRGSVRVAWDRPEQTRQGP